jgi:hypothetical protein
MGQIKQIVLSLKKRHMGARLSRNLKKNAK